MFANEQGKLNWYCLDFGATHWTLISRPSRLSTPTASAGDPRQKRFTATAGQSLDVVLITNAHPLTLEMKAERLPIAQWFDKMISSHDYGAPKETLAFWNALMGERPFNPERTLFMDDSEHVLDSAKAFGIAALVTLRQPDSTIPPREVTRFPAIHHFDEISEGLPRVD